ncbi:nuclear transport factor 2 family protein [Streptomyces sp. Li-HN-5-11]|uniref:nuclear transport factor 2 family protein n=1 Tax=Streptomyces sp. Li-HN-5-11 TaxID=3075432 RepID=UPI0028A581D4|nr:nuclear transport factor 2 family protein [Streptomyces sp. Li-HN-5-11]WNM34173.1 nuclear transport factor 2 family protein [Streptomyces sp. Li-HN-5-11]
MSSWTRGLPAALAVCAVLLAGAAGCGSSGAHGGKEGESSAPAGRLLDHTDEEGQHYREVDKKGAPDVGVEVRPDAGGSWDVRLTVRRFRFSPSGTAARATAGRGLVHLLVDGRLVCRLRTPEYRLAARLVPHGTHHVTARLYADDGTVWAVAGRPVQSTADITASAPDPGRGPGAGSGHASKPAAPTGGDGASCGPGARGLMRAAGTPGARGAHQGAGGPAAARKAVRSGGRASPDCRGTA